MRVAGSVCVALCCTTNTLPPRLEHAQADKKTMTGSASVTGGNGKTAQIVGPNWFSGMLTMHVIDGALSPAPAAKKAATAAAPAAPVARWAANPLGRRLMQYSGDRGDLATSIGINDAQAAIQRAVSGSGRGVTMAATDANQALTYSVGECQAGVRLPHMFEGNLSARLDVKQSPLTPTNPQPTPTPRASSTTVGWRRGLGNGLRSGAQMASTKPDRLVLGHVLATQQPITTSLAALTHSSLQVTTATCRQMALPQRMDSTVMHQVVHEHAPLYAVLRGCQPWDGFARLCAWLPSPFAAGPS